MYISAIDLSKEQLLLLPAEARLKIEENKAIVYGIIEKNEILSYIVLTQSNAISFCILHIYLSEAASTDCLVQLLSHVMEICQNLDMDLVTAKLVGKETELAEIIKILKNAGFADTQQPVRYLSYGIQTIWNTEILSTKVNDGFIDKYIVPFDQLDRKQMGEFFEKCKRLKKRINFRNTDSRFGRFFVMDNKIAGYLDIKETASHILTLHDMILENNEKAKYAFAALLSSSLVANDSMIAEDTILYVQLKNPKLITAITKLFGEADYDGYLYELRKEID